MPKAFEKNEEETDEDARLVYLNTYDLIEQNKWLHCFGMGIYHSGVEVYGLEVAFGGHPYDSPGIFATHPRGAPGCVQFRESICLGPTSLTRAEVKQLLVQLGRKYKGNSYNLLQCNCNTFAEELCHRLTGKKPPSWINRAAYMAIQLHCLFPAGWMPPLRPPEALPSEEGSDDPTQVLLHVPPSGSDQIGNNMEAAFSRGSVAL